MTTNNNRRNNQRATNRVNRNARRIMRVLDRSWITGNHCTYRNDHDVAHVAYVGQVPQ